MKLDVVFRAVIGNVQIICLGGIFGGKGIDLFNKRRDTQRFAMFADFEHIGGDVNGCMLINDFSNLEIRESGAFEFAHKIVGYLLNVVELLGLFAEIEDVFEPVQKPLVYLGDFVDFIDGKTICKSVSNGKNTHVGRLGEFLLDIVDMLIGDKTVHTLSNHPKSLLDSLFKGATNGHHLADRLHRRSNFLAYAHEFIEVPTRNLDDAIVQRRLKTSRSYLCDSVFEFVETIAEAEFCSNECKRIACRLGCQSR